METKKKQVITEDLALQELKKVVDRFSRKNNDVSKLKDNYPISLSAICDGILSFDENLTPKYELRYPVKSESGEIQVSEITFKTRIKPTVKADLADGLDLQKSAAKFSLRLMAHVAQQPTVQMLDKFEPEDYDLIQELSPVFM